MMKFWLTVIMSVYLSAIVMAQDVGIFTLRGKVVDEAMGQPLPYATVALVRFPDIEKILKGVVTDGKGEFVLQAKQDNYNLIVRNLGYQNFTKQLLPEMGSIVELGVIRMKVCSERLEVVTVKPLVESSVDEIRYNLINDPDRETASLHEILDKVPLIHRLPMGDIYVEEPGKKFLIVRNGKVDALFSGNVNDALKAIPAKGFATVTVLLAPPERYGEYDYIINIETDKSNRLLGAVGLLKDESDFVDGTFKPEASVLTSLDKLRMSWGGNFENRNAPENKRLICKQQTGEERIFKQEQKNEISGEEWQVGGYFSYDLAKQHFLTWRLVYGEKDNRDKSRLNSGYGGEDMEIINSVNRKNSHRWRGELNYQYDGKKRRVLNVAYSLSAVPERRNDIREQLEELAREEQTEQALQIHYYNPLNRKLKLEMGGGYLYRYYVSENRALSTQGGQATTDALMKTRMHIMNAYLRLYYTKKRFSTSVGLKTDYLYDGAGTLIEAVDHQERISEKGLNFMPDVQMSFLFPKSKLSRLTLSYQFWNYRPALKMLSVYEDASTPVFIRSGNPKLDNERLHTLKCNTTLYGVNITASWNYSGNLIGSYWYQDEYNRTVQTYINNGKSDTYSLVANYNYIYKGLSFNMMLSGGYSCKEIPQQEKQENWKVMVTGMAGYTFRNQWSLGVNMGYFDNFYSGYSAFYRSRWMLGCSVQKKFF